jgi:DNA-binding NtrC family response regulator
VPVLIVGERGTGKRKRRALHYLSNRWDAELSR